MSAVDNEDALLAAVDRIYDPVDLQPRDQAIRASSKVLIGNHGSFAQSSVRETGP
jgi:hypothetical protein